MHERLAVYVPEPDAPAEAARTVAHIDRGSGIVGMRVVEADEAESPVLLYYEDNRFGASNMERYADRVMHAAGRMNANYPTVARCLARQDALIHVGWWYPEHGRVVIEDVPEQGRALYRIAAWLDHPLEDPTTPGWLSEQLRETPRPMSVREAIERGWRR